MACLGGTKEKEGFARGTTRLLHSSIALHPFETDDSEQAVRMFPNRGDFSYRNGFGGVTTRTLFARASEAARNSAPWLLVASAPLPSTH